MLDFVVGHIPTSEKESNVLTAVIDRGLPHAIATSNLRLAGLMQSAMPGTDQRS